LSEEEMVKRGGFGDERYETIEFQAKVRHCFNQWIDNDPCWVVIDASQSQKQVLDDLEKNVLDLIPRVENSNVSDTLFMD
jgi:dTMP kinase